MKLINHVTTATLALCIVITANQSASAQFNVGRAIGNAGKRLESSVRTEAGRASSDFKRVVHGKPFKFTLRNPTQNAIHYKVDGKPHLLRSGYKQTISGRGPGKITFDIGARDRSYQSYNLSSGRTYVFKWKDVYLPATFGKTFILKLYLDR
jgi:hypothetical protein